MMVVYFGIRDQMRQTTCKAGGSHHPTDNPGKGHYNCVSMKTFKPLMAGFCLVVKYYGCNPSKMLWAIFLSSGIMQSIRICSVPVYRYTPFKHPHTTPRESYDGRDSDTIGNVRRWLW